LFPSPGPGCQARTGEATSIIAANNPNSTIDFLNSFSFPEASPYCLLRIVRGPPFHKGGAVGKPAILHDAHKYATLQEIAHHANGLFLLLLGEVTFCQTDLAAVYGWTQRLSALRAMLPSGRSLSMGGAERLVRWIPAPRFRGDKLRGNDSDSL
jgi:hypothetical protein